jgi:hypothetical protein
MSEFTTYKRTFDFEEAYAIYNMDYLKKKDSDDLSCKQYDFDSSSSYINNRRYDHSTNYNEIKWKTEYEFRKKDNEDDYHLKSQECLNNCNLELKQLEIQYEKSKNKIETELKKLENQYERRINETKIKYRIIQKTIDDKKKIKLRELDERKYYLNNSKNSRNVDFSKSDFYE